MKTSDINKYAIIENNSDRKVKRNELFKDMLITGKSFNYFVLSSLDFFFNAGDKQINIINDLLKMAQKSNGMNASRLANYLKVVINHEFEEGDNAKNKPPIFKGKIEATSYMDFKEVQHFISINPEWHKFGRNDSTKQFDLDTLLAMVADKIDKNNVTVVDFEKGLEQLIAKRAYAKVAGE